MAAVQYDVFSVDTSSGTKLEPEVSTWNGPGVKVGGPFPTLAAAQAFITGNPNALTPVVLQQDQADVGDWVVVPEGEIGDITNAIAAGFNQSLAADFLDETGLFGSTTGTKTTWTVTQLTTPQDVQNAETANLILYKTKALASAETVTLNKGAAPKTNAPNLGNLFSAAFGGNFHGTNFVVRAAKVIIGGLLLIIGLVHITGADNAIASVAKKVPLPV